MPYPNQTYAKTGDSVPLVLDLGVELASIGYTSAKVIVGRRGRAPIVSRAGSIDGTTVTITLTPLETARPGPYMVEVEMMPGPHTYPSHGYAMLTLLDDLDYPGN